MQFQVPQFIEVEDKIFGPFTFKQFIYVAGGAGLAYLLWQVLPLFIAAPLIAGALGLGAAFAFLNINGRPFILAVEHGFYFLTHPKLYLWNNEMKKKDKKKVAKKVETDVHIPKLSDSKLHELAWSLDIKERIDESEQEVPERSEEVMAPIRTAKEARV